MTSFDVQLLVAVLLSCLADRDAQELTMQSRGHVIVADAGRSVEMPCEFSSREYSMFENPVIWRKIQADEETSINIMGNILEPFLGTGRFEVLLHSEPPTYAMTLKISALYPEDSGNYSCEIRGRRSTILATVVHLISVRVPVTRVTLDVEEYPPPLLSSVDDGSYYGNQQQQQQQQQLSPPGSASSHYHDTPSKSATVRRVTFIEGAPRRTRCVAIDGFPLPEMQIYIGDVDVTRQFVLSQSVTLEGTAGLRSIRYRTERTSDSLQLTSRDDSQPMRCVVTVPGLTANQTVVYIDVLYRPLITCPVTSASVGDRNVALRCEVSARPPLSALFWIIDVNGTTVTEGQLVNEYWTLVMDRNDGVMETKLFMKQALTNSFRRYTLVAENSIAASTADAQLLHTFKSTSKPSTTLLPVTSSPEIAHSDVLVQPRDLIRRRNQHGGGGGIPDNPEYISIRSSSSSSAAAASATFQLPFPASLAARGWYSLPLFPRTDFLRQLYTSISSAVWTLVFHCVVPPRVLDLVL